MRLLLLTGKGGVGTSTVAAAIATHAARCGLKTLLVGLTGTTGPDDVLGTGTPPGELAPPAGSAQAGGPGEPVEVLPGLAVLRLDARSGMATAWPRLAGPFGAALSGLAADLQAAEELTALPGVPAVADLLAVAGQAAADRWDLVVVDGPAADQVVPWVGLPDALARWLDLVLPVEQRVHRAIAIGAVVGQVAGQAADSGPGSAAAPVDGLAAGLDRLAAALAGARDLLTGPDAAAVLVTSCSAGAVRASARARAGLALHGVPVAAVVVNRCAAGRTGPVADALPGLPVRPLAELPDEPVGPDALAALGEQLLTGPPDGVPGDLPGGLAGGLADALLGGAPAAGAAPAGLRVTPTEGPEPGFLLELPLPVDDPGALDLTRQGDDLVVQVGPHRRAVRLAPVLRRCTVRRARLADGLLTVLFEPDPALWPVG